MMIKVSPLLFIGLLVTLFSCGKVENSNSVDEDLYGIYVDVGSPNFLAVKAALKPSCLKCHGSWKRYTEQDFVDSGLVVRGNAAESRLYYRNIFATKGLGPKTMPQAGYPPISPGDISVMEQWINAL